MFSGRLPASSGLLPPLTPTRNVQPCLSAIRQAQPYRELSRRLNTSQAAEPSGQEPFYGANEHQRRQDSSAGPAVSLERLGADHLLQLLRARQSSPAECPGEVYLVGTGPGDPGLLTLKAVQLLQTADVVLYDRLVSTDILKLIHNGARMVYVGKESSFHTRTQDEIHELLCQFAQEHVTVVRLKGGDPYVFGRGGEELQYLEERGVQVHCIPGITAASGISAELGIPLTHRGMATSVRFLTGERDLYIMQTELIGQMAPAEACIAMRTSNWGKGLTIHATG
ncbi:hypothetical protein WJX84_011166 [Apatococcus fuscideae]|uniref:uroporphyrinogen-III C-methyltransferase n=1 Tax=Apatococcus fuscideae TaxID=2026836 RepID=A0AAW1SMQ9_9CHLO